MLSSAAPRLHASSPPTPPRSLASAAGLPTPVTLQQPLLPRINSPGSHEPVPSNPNCTAPQHEVPSPASCPCHLAPGLVAVERTSACTGNSGDHHTHSFCS